MEIYIDDGEIQTLCEEHLRAEAEYCEPGLTWVEGWMEFAIAVLKLNEEKREKLQSNS